MTDNNLSEKLALSSDKIPSQQVRSVGVSSVETQSAPPSRELFEFLDYRDFLKVKLDEVKQKNPNLTMGAMARRMGVSTAFLSQLISKKRHLSLSNFPKICSTLKLSNIDEVVFLFLVLEATVDKPELKTLFQYLKGQAGGLTLLAKNRELNLDLSSATSLFLDDLHMVLDALARTHSFSPDLQSVMESLRGYQDVEKSTVALALSNVLKKRAALKLAKEDSLLVTDMLGVHDIQSVYSMGMKAMSRALTPNSNMRPNAFAGLTIPLSREKAREAFTAFSEFCAKLNTLSEESVEPDQVYFLNAGLFCAANNYPKKEKP